MKITLDLPDPLFKQGDVMRWGPHGLIVHIYRVEISGKWEHYNGKTDAWIERNTYYHCTVQTGRGPQGDLIRPGTCTGFPEEGDPEHQMIGAEKIEWDQPIIEPDTANNITERWKAWKKLHPELERAKLKRD